MAYRQTGVTNSQWVAWAINIGRSGMVGTQCLVGVVSSNGLVQGYTSSVTSYKTRLQPTRLSFDVPSITAELVNGDVVIYATLVLPSRRTSFNQLWQVGPVAGGAPLVHRMGSANRKAVGTVDFTTGQTSAVSGDTGGSRKRQRNTHGVLNALSWGVIMPMGAMAARYLKVFKAANPAWFYIHVTCQVSAYIVGVAGWATVLPRIFLTNNEYNNE
ncbi:putative DOMON domain, cytochrome b561/ferric reductase transmembrane [Helianthus annuus]|nr:putative DOMON domain, cytochrome b561/ferric reductase transmembrane [Helianthus annuus]KAJ0577788.1 putative DOMON domain, cytochrome b561/ferric reductase transmembrane [Helianthus annuus]KAJ0923393.1 putative DOMON domain, cytochrome b561/ferric reductase transmembrane [Helianthus annuus]